MKFQKGFKMAKLIFEDRISQVDVEDSGCARIAVLDPDDYGQLFVKLQSWDEECNHPEFNEFYGKRVRVTIETLDD